MALSVPAYASRFRFFNHVNSSGEVAWLRTFTCHRKRVAAVLSQLLGKWDATSMQGRGHRGRERREVFAF